MTQKKVSDVFKTTGQPQATYVARNKGVYEKKLREGVESGGRVCLVTGPSKTGKTTLYGHVLSELGYSPLIVRCDDNVSSEDFWKQALEAIDFSRISEISNTNNTESSGVGKVQGSLGWSWLAGLIGEVSLGVKKGMEDSEIRERILAKPSPNHLIPVLRELALKLVVEDFHYLNESVQRTIFQQWKVFVDEEISVIVVGTTHHAVDLARANKDLLGRITQIEAGVWPEEDLLEIAKKGFKYLGVPLDCSVVKPIKNESAGLPIIVQDVCRQLFFDKNIYSLSGARNVYFSRGDVYQAMHNVAYNNYAQLEGFYQRLITGPRKRGRKYETYELIIAAFGQDPIVFSLQRHEIEQRFDKMGLPADKRPPPASINSTLTALRSFQERYGIELLEWVYADQKLFIVEPAFLFYIRWRQPRTSPPTLADTVKSLLNSFESWGNTQK